MIKEINDFTDLEISDIIFNNNATDNLMARRLKCEKCGRIKSVPCDDKGMLQVSKRSGKPYVEIIKRYDISEWRIEGDIGPYYCPNCK